MRLERPSNQWQDPFHIWYSLSPDLRYWGDSELLLGCEDVPFANKKIGGGAPMLEIPEGYEILKGQKTVKVTVEIEPEA